MWTVCVYNKTNMYTSRSGKYTVINCLSHICECVGNCLAFVIEMITTLTMTTAVMMWALRTGRMSPADESAFVLLDLYIIFVFYVFSCCKSNDLHGKTTSKTFCRSLNDI